jgi:hypothetical protein
VCKSFNPHRIAVAKLRKTTPLIPHEKLDIWYSGCSWESGVNEVGRMGELFRTHPQQQFNICKAAETIEKREQLPIDAPRGRMRDASRRASNDTHVPGTGEPPSAGSRA